MNKLYDQINVDDELYILVYYTIYKILLSFPT